jgi:hypothetical protein
MKNISLRYGLFASGIMIGIALITYSLWGNKMNLLIGEIIGYTSMILALLAIYLGIKQCRDQQMNGEINYIQGLGVGLAITAIASLLFAGYCYVFFAYLEPDFLETYYKYHLDSIRQSGETAEVIQTKIAEAERVFKSGWITNLPFQTFVMFTTVFVLGLVISLISAAILKRKSININIT